jgi:hypothetical protein
VESEQKRSAVCVWRPEHGLDLVDPSCTGSFSSMEPAGKVFNFSKEASGWLILIYGDKTYRVKEKAIREVPALEFDVNQQVMVGDRIAVIGDIFWHFKDERPFYFLIFDGKRSSRRYLDDEITKP